MQFGKMRRGPWKHTKGLTFLFHHPRMTFVILPSISVTADITNKCYSSLLADVLGTTDQRIAGQDRYKFAIHE